MKSLGLRQSFLSFAGLLAGVWIAISPWVLGYPGSGGGAWSASEFSAAAAGGAVIAASAICLVASMTSSVHQMVRLAEQRDQEGAPSEGIGR
ncbi:MAG: SPW repeat protein [Candidatus Dormibacteraeota bacterium]|nr:SPW repeat protein [Candidatus Dormibacteraeota bacterium]